MHQPKLHPLKQYGLMYLTWELNPLLQIRHQPPRISHPIRKVHRKVCEKNLEKAKEQMKLNADKHHLAAPTYEIGQQVWLATKNLQLTHTSRKLLERWLGPYKIIGLAGPNAIKLQLPRSLQIHPVVNVSWVKPYHERMEGKTSYWPGLVHMTKDRDNE